MKRHSSVFMCTPSFEMCAVLCGEVRAGPVFVRSFSVESLRRHSRPVTADENQDGTITEEEAHEQQDFATMIFDNLKKAGVQNTRKEERLTFDRLDRYAGAWLHATGEYTDFKGKTRRVAVSIGPEHGTVGPQQVKKLPKKQSGAWALTCLLFADLPLTHTSPRRPNATAN